MAKKNLQLLSIDMRTGELTIQPLERALELNPALAADGKYYLEPNMTNVLFAQRKLDEGVEVYCAECKAPLSVSSEGVFCTNDEEHFAAVLGGPVAVERPRKK